VQKNSLSKFRKKIKRKTLKTVNKFVSVLYLLQRRIHMGCNCGKSNKAKGNIIITDSATRMVICEVCTESNKNSVIGLVCGKLAQPTKKTCGCILKLKTKIRSQRCPQGKW
jgi:hypothetical protein|tara:strand:+ start:541 stop:873 length:333 start_codon:yes stop_codon:yes gene_type:complete